MGSMESSRGTPLENTHEDLIFALDIGTRSIIGIVGRPEGDLFCVQAKKRIEHPKRAMIDGQIEDIDQVARVAGEVKRQLEEELGHPLKKVAVAAAGRALKTRRAGASLPLNGEYVTAQIAYELEQIAVNEARASLDASEDGVRYFCVGHSVVQYKIDDYPFTSIYDHRGDIVSAEVIATFLPAEVVGSLRRCMEMIELEIETLSLEPIAAMRAVLPYDVRLLNLALIDIGAGTADIALTRDGAVSGYTMATVAGDEITEAVIRKFLVDFSTAEAIKLATSGEEPITYKDILGHEHTCMPGDVVKAIDIAVEMLAKVISDRVLEANEGPPAAVFLVGGGANTPGLAERLADKIGLEEERVGIAGTNFSGRVLCEGSGLDAPEYATPVGIALVAADQLASGAATLLINGHKVHLFGEQEASVMDALLIAGYRYSDLMGRNGRSLTFTLNGTRKVLRGGAYSVADVSLNGKPASLTSPVGNGDVLEVVPATSGEDAAATVATFAEGATGFYVTLNGHRVNAGLVAYLNGSPAAPDNEIQELDEVDIHVIDTVGGLCRSLGYSPDAMTLSANKIPATDSTPLQEGDAIEANEVILPPRVQPPAPPPVARAAEAIEMHILKAEERAEEEPPVEDAPEEESLAGKPALEPEAKEPEPEEPQVASSQHKAEEHRFPSVLDRRGQEPSAKDTEEPVSEEKGVEPEPDEKLEQETSEKEPPKEASNSTSSEPTRPAGAGRVQIELNGKNLVLPPKPGGEPHTLIDLLPLIDIDPANPKGKLVLEINKQGAGYLDELKTGDAVIIGWEE